ncbi:MAG TPA: HEAT repeat domain-containing protein [Polyangia bacterium]|jgi:HEAT repeat protein|nr:HEAT repeat domain-containing protein [Polyangia bacterium]
MPPPFLGMVSVHDLSPAGSVAVTLDTDALEESLRRRLLKSGVVVAPATTDGSAGDDPAAAPPTVRLRGEVALDGAEVPGKALARVAVRMQLDTRPSDAPGAIDEQLEGEGEKTYVVSKGASAAASRALQQQVFATLAERVAVDLLDGALARLKLRSASPESIHIALTADGGDLREEAIRLAGQRQLHQEVPRLLDLLTNDDEATRDAALGALIALKEPRAVSVLTKSRSLRDRREMRKIIEALSLLGGEEALDYLSFVAATHDDDEIRGQAAQAHERLLRRLDAGH